jgi:hypothetical protein
VYNACGALLTIAQGFPDVQTILQGDGSTRLLKEAMDKHGGIEHMYGESAFALAAESRACACVLFAYARAHAACMSSAATHRACADGFPHRSTGTEVANLADWVGVNAKPKRNMPALPGKVEFVTGTTVAMRLVRQGVRVADAPGVLLFANYREAVPRGVRAGADHAQLQHGLPAHDVAQRHAGAARPQVSGRKGFATVTHDDAVTLSCAAIASLARWRVHPRVL